MLLDWIFSSKSSRNKIKIKGLEKPVYRHKGAYQVKAAIPEPYPPRKGAYQLKTSLAIDSDIKR